MIIPHLYGHCWFDKLLKLAKNKKIIVLEDATQNMGAKYKNKYLGTFVILVDFHSMEIK